MASGGQSVSDGRGNVSPRTPQRMGAPAGLPGYRQTAAAPVADPSTGEGGSAREASGAAGAADAAAQTALPARSPASGGSRAVGGSGGPAVPRPSETCPLTILLDVSDWSAELLGEYREVERGRLGAPLSADEIAGWLKAVERRNRAHAGDQVEDPEAERSGPGLLERSVTVAGTGVRLRLPTIAARIRIGEAEAAEERGELAAGDCLLRTAYCLAHGRDRAALERLADGAAAVAVCREWAAAELTCPEAAVEAAVAELVDGAFPDEEPDPGAPRTPDWPGLVQALHTRCGGESEYWLHGPHWAHAAWMLRAAGRESRRRERALAEAAGRAAPVDPDDPAVVAIGRYRETKRELMEAKGMRRATVDLGEGRSVQIRELTYGELQRIRAEGETLPVEWPILEQFRGREAELAGLGASEVQTAAEAVYRLTFGAAGEGLPPAAEGTCPPGPPGLRLAPDAAEAADGAVGPAASAPGAVADAGTRDGGPG